MLSSKSMFAVIVAGSALLLTSCTSVANKSDSDGLPALRRGEFSSSFVQKLVVGNTLNGSILAFGLPTAGGSVAPTQDIVSTVPMGDMKAVAVGPNGAIFASDYYHGYVLKFAHDATGTVSPVSQLDVRGGAMGVAIDSAGHPWVAVDHGGSQATDLEEFAVNASGNATPICTIVGPKTGLTYQSLAWSLSFDAAGNLYVADYIRRQILAYPPGACGNVSPIITLAGSNTKLSGPEAITIDGSSYGMGRLLVANIPYGSSTNGTVAVFTPGANGNVAPTQLITSVSFPGGVAADSLGQIYVSAPLQPSIRIFGPSATGNATPVAKITGSNGDFSKPGPLAIAPY